jgi:hypothetical protein
MMFTLLLLAGCVSVHIETPCADSELNIKIPHVGIRTCATSHDPIHPKPKEVPDESKP